MMLIVRKSKLWGKNKYAKAPPHLIIFTQSCFQTRAQDERHKGRAAKQAEQQKTDMLNSKKYVSIATIHSLSVTHLMVTSTYLISATVANQIKDKFYTADMPGVQNVSSWQSRVLSPKWIKLPRNSVSPSFWCDIQGLENRSRTSTDSTRGTSRQNFGLWPKPPARPSGQS